MPPLLSDNIRATRALPLHHAELVSVSYRAAIVRVRAVKDDPGYLPPPSSGGVGSKQHISRFFRATILYSTLPAEDPARI